MAEGSSVTSSEFPSTTWTSATSGFPTSTGQFPNSWSTGAGQNPSISPPPNDPNQLSTPLLFTDSSLSSTPSPTRENSTETSAGSLTTRPGRQLNVAAIAIGVTGAALLLIACTVIAFNLWKRKQRKKVPPSAEFKDLTVPWNPKLHRKTSESITSWVLTPKDGASFTSFPYESTKYNVPVSPYSPHPNTPPWSP